MSISNPQQKVSYTGNNTTTVFTIPFYFQNATDIDAVQIVAATGTVLHPPSGITIAGAGVSSGGSLTFSVAPATGDTIIIRRIVSLTQPNHFVDGEAFSAASFETPLDHGIMAAQQLEEELSRVPEMPVDVFTQNPGLSLALPAPAAGAALGWDPTGKNLANLFVPGVTATYVATFNGRSGAVVPQAGDYTATQVGANSSADVANNASATKGAGLVGFSSALAYAAGTVGAFLVSLVSSAGSSLIGFLQAGAGAVARFIQDKLREQVSVMDFGAKGDGVTDDTAAIQAAMTAASNGGIVLFPQTTSNTYLVSAALKFYPGQTLRGAGGVGISTGGTIIRLTAASTSVIEPNTPGTTTNGFNAEGIYFDAQGNAPCAVKFYNTSHSTLKNIGANCTAASGAAILLDANVSLQTYFNVLENCRAYGTGTGGAGIRFQNGANVNTVIGGRCGSGNYYGLDFLSLSSGNTIIGMDIEGATTAAVHVDAPGNIFKCLHMESEPIGFSITSNGGSTHIFAPTFASSVTTPISDASTLGCRLYSTPDTNSTAYLRAGSFNAKSTYLSTGSNWDFDPTLFSGTANSLIRWWLNTTTTGTKQWTIYNGDGTSNFGFQYIPGLLACNAFSVANQVVAATGNWRAHSTATFKFRNNGNTADLIAFTKTTGDIFQFGDASASGHMHMGVWGEGVGGSVASAATITPTAKVTPVSGTAAISTINIPFTGFTGVIYLLPSAAWTLATGGNIGKASTAVANQMMTLAWDGTKWWPSY